MDPKEPDPGSWPQREASDTQVSHVEDCAQLPNTNNRPAMRDYPFATDAKGTAAMQQGSLQQQRELTAAMARISHFQGRKDGFPDDMICRDSVPLSPSSIDGDTSHGRPPHESFAMRVVSQESCSTSSQHREFEELFSRSSISTARPLSPDIDEEAPVSRPTRYSVQSSSKDSGVIMDSEDMPATTNSRPRPHKYDVSYFDTDDESEAEISDAGSIADRCRSDFDYGQSSFYRTPYLNHTHQAPTPSASSQSSHTFDVEQDDSHRLTKILGVGNDSDDVFSWERPDDDQVVQGMFLALMERRGWHNLPDVAKRQMLAYSPEKKWTLIYQDGFAEWKARKKDDMGHRQLLDGHIGKSMDDNHPDTEALSNLQMARLSLNDSPRRVSIPDFDSDDQATITEDVSDAQVDKILNFSLRTVLGVGLADLGSARRELGRSLTLRFAETLAGLVESIAIPEDFDQYPTSSNTRTSSGEDFRGEEPRRPEKSAGKRKRASDPEGNLQQGSGDGCEIATASASATKRQRPTLRIRCPYRARNPHRFNVRDHQGCAMTYFSYMSDLRQHVVKKHVRDDTSTFSCPRCNDIFETKSEQDTHIKRPEGCPSRDLDPEDGVDGETIMRILDRHRQTTKSGGEILVEKQWAELWMLIFHHDDPNDIPSYKYHAVMEDCEFALEWKSLSAFLAAELQLKFGLTGDAPEELRKMLLEHLDLVVETVRAKARDIRYDNRPRPQNANRPGQRRSEVISSVLQNIVGQFSPRDSAIGTETSSNRASDYWQLSFGNNNNNMGHMSMSTPLRPSSQLHHSSSFPEMSRSSISTPPNHQSIVPLTPENLARNEAVVSTAAQDQFLMRPGLHLDVGMSSSQNISTQFSSDEFLPHLASSQQLYQATGPHSAGSYGQSASAMLQTPVSMSGGGHHHHHSMLDESQLSGVGMGILNNNNSNNTYGNGHVRMQSLPHHHHLQQQHPNSAYNNTNNTISYQQQHGVGFGQQFQVNGQQIPPPSVHHQLSDSSFIVDPGVDSSGNPNMI
ncbi:hypothetical protein B0H63DRAFT_565359 [Podospora didyma]|uniref:Formin GTPase-binding domain-containing protein n=1 Tax=Podospora didyma TaxID=330526 RepID=A0AAE0K3E7_9PEZI|nr:hypothetical protein B0H63DRAFT_565359 [Podospora didyma]